MRATFLDYSPTDDITTTVRPPPEYVGDAGKKSRYPFGVLPVGGSFEVERECRKRAQAMAARWKRLHPGWDYRSLTTKGRTRIWRVA